MVRISMVFCFISLMLSVVILYANSTFALSANGVPSCSTTLPTPTTIPQTDTPAITSGAIIFTELVLSPNSPWNCAAVYSKSKNSHIWIELYNSLNQPVDLYALGLYMQNHSDFTDTPILFQPGDVIPPFGYLVVFPFAHDPYPPPDISTLRLFLDTELIDQVTHIPPLLQDYAYTRAATSSSEWYITPEPTFGTGNIISTPTLSPTATQVRATPTVHSTKAKSPTPTKTTTKITTASNKASTPPSTGTQPAWQHLQRPQKVSSSIAQPSTPEQTHQGMQESSVVSDFPQKIVITVLFMALAGALFWCWKIFGKN